MEMVRKPRGKPAYYFSWSDQEILDDRILALSCDAETWLYKVETTSFSGQFSNFQLGYQYQNHQTPTTGGSVDTRTFTRRKHCSLRPSLESVMESPFSNRSSLGLLSTSKLLNDTLQPDFTPTQILINPEKISSSSIVSDKKPIPCRIFKLDSPFLNSPTVDDRVSQFPVNNSNFERPRFDSESSDISLPHSLENFGSLERNDVMTDSLVNFLDKQEVNCRPPTEFQDESSMTDSLVSLPGNCEIHNSLNIHGKVETMTDSMVNFLVPVNCKPPSGFEDNEMTSSVVNIEETDVLPTYDMTYSVVDYLENVKSKSSAPMIESTVSSETENIPPDNCISEEDEYAVINSNCTDRLKASDDERIEEIKKLNSTYELEKNGDITFNLSNESDEITNITYTNSVNIARTKDRGDIEEGSARMLNTTFKKDYSPLKDNSERNLKTRALNNRDLNVTRELNNEEMKDLNSTKTLTKDFIPNKINSTVSPRRYGTYTKSELNETLSLSRQIPSRNSTFNTTFTKLQFQTKDLNTTFTKSTEGLNGGIEDDQTSSASDSSFSSGSTKPRSVDELRSIAQQQESSLAQQTSTPESVVRSSEFAKLDLELSPIRRPSALPSRNNESRSANSSPVRYQQPTSTARPHPISRLQQPSAESRRQTLQASSLSNIARPKMSGLRMPQPVKRFAASQRPENRASTAPVHASTGIPRPQSSRLPVSSFRASGIPGLKRGGLH